MVLFGWIFREKAHGLFISCHRCGFKIMSDVMHMFLHKVCVVKPGKRNTKKGGFEVLYYIKC